MQVDLKSFWEKHYLLFHPRTTAAATRYIESFFAGESRNRRKAMPADMLQVQDGPFSKHSVVSSEPMSAQ
jgi:hypothetical protein